jgi:Ser/Thr protein kinase RdoA (MazF antagonist)
MIPVPPEVLANLAREFGAPVEELSPLSGQRAGADGMVYAWPGEEEPRVLKVLAFPAKDTGRLLRLEERIKFARFVGERGARIVLPLARPDGGLWATCALGDQIFAAYAMPRIAGENPGPERWSEAFLMEWGKAIGAMHRITQDYPAWQCSLVEGQSLLGWQEEWQGFLEWCQDAEVKAYWLALKERLVALPVRRDCYGFIHNDPHMQNILAGPTGGAFGAGEITLLDFDVANYHWFITDISIAVQSVLFATGGGMERPVQDAGALSRFLDSFMKGYESENHLDSFWLDQLDLFIAYRRALLFIAMQDWLATEPALHQAWKERILAEPPVYKT